MVGEETFVALATYSLDGHGLVQLFPHGLIDVAKHNVARDDFSNGRLFHIIQMVGDGGVGLKLNEGFPLRVATTAHKQVHKHRFGAMDVSMPNTSGSCWPRTMHALVRTEK